MVGTLCSFFSSRYAKLICAVIPPMVAVIFAWRCIALTRIPMELGYLGVVKAQKMVWLRVLLGILLALVAGLLAGFVAFAVLK